MKFVFAPDSFKGSLSAIDAVSLLTEAARRKAAEQAAAQKAAEEEAERLAREAEAARLAQEEARREAAEAQAAAIAVQRLRLGLMIGGAALARHLWEKRKSTVSNENQTEEQSPVE